MKTATPFLAAALAIIAASACLSCKAEQTFQAPGPGKWYPAGKQALAEMVDGFLAEKPGSPIAGRPVGIISPHAGYPYSGKCAGAAFSAIKGLSYDRVVVIGISHGLPFNGAALLRVGSYSTPLGKMQIDTDANDQLLRNKLFASMPEAFSPEHSLDNQLPFIQRALKGDFKLVPIIIGMATPQDVKAIAQQVKPLLQGNALIVVSSDFTHHGASYDYVHFTKDLKDNLKKLAMSAAQPILKLDYDGFMKHIEGTGDTICGRNSIGVLLNALPRESKGTLARFYTSGDVLGDYSSSVSYLSFVFTQGEPNAQKEKTMMINEKSQAALLSIARQTVEAAIAGKKIPSNEVADPDLQREQGAFVTLTRNGELRGCIGQFTATEPLYMVVRKMARASALEDPRFDDRRLKPADIADVKIEISVLSPMTRVKDPLKEVKIGTHGIYIRRGFNAGTFLPQVATEYKMGLEEFLSTCCAHKAGLPPDAWKDPATEVYIYSAQVFGE